MKMQQNDQLQYIDPPIHEWFGLGRTAYFVMPRLALQELPAEWQKQFIALMDEARAYGLETPDYTVLRKEQEYTTSQDDDEDYPYKYTAWRADPWANYRRGTVNDLCPGFSVSEKCIQTSDSEQEETK